MPLVGATRLIILQTPLLWSTVEDSHGCNKVPSFTHYIHHCPRGPLFVRLRHRWPHELTMAFLAAQGQRVRDLSTNKLEFFDAITSFRAEQLRDCDISLYIHQYMGPPFQMFFQGCAPQLQRLHLRGSPYLPHNDFPALTHLTLICPSTVAFSVEDFQAFLSGCPRLQSLHIRTRVTSGIQAPGSTSAARCFLSLSNLRKFSLIDILEPEDWQDPIHALETRAGFAQFLLERSALQSALLSAIVQTSLCLVDITPVTFASLHSCADRLSALIRPSCMRIDEALLDFFYTPEGILSLTLVHPSESQGVRFEVQSDHPQHVDEESDDEGSNEDMETIENPQNLLQHIIATSSLFSDIHKLWMDHASPAFLCPPHSILKSLPRLKHLHISCNQLDDNSACSILDTLSDVEGGSIVCPELNSLWMVLPSRVSLEALLERMRALLMWRKSSGHPLKRLLIILGGGHDPSNAAQDVRTRFGGLVKHFVLVSGARPNWAQIERENPWLKGLDWHYLIPPECRYRPDETSEDWPIWE